MNLLPRVALVLLGLGLVALAPPDFQVARAELEAALAERLGEIAAEANQKKGFATRNRCYEAMIVVDPDDATARRGLKHKRVDGGWEEPAKARTVKDKTSKKVEALAAEVDALLGGFREDVAALIETHGEELGKDGRLAAWRRLVEFAPDDAELRAKVGEALLGGQWVLTETASAMERRTRLHQVAEEAKADVRLLAPAAPDAWEEGLDVDWTTGWQTERVRVFGTGEPDEVEEATRALHGLGDLVSAAFGERVDLSPRYAVYLFAEPGEKAIVLRRIPGGRGSQVANLEHAWGGWLGVDDRFGNWSDDRPRRIDGATRTTVAEYLKRTFRITLNHGWASEGLGLYLTEAMVGTKLTWFTKTDRYVAQNEEALESFSLESADEDWLREGRELLTGPNPPALGLLIGRRVSAMGPRDLLHAYVLAAYLLEGRPEQLPALLHAIGRNSNPTRAFEAILGEPLPVLEERLTRWLVEVTDQRDRLSR